MSDLVLVDTCVWAPIFNQPETRRGGPIARLLRVDRAAIVGPIYFEILIGIRRNERAQWVASRLDGLRWLDITPRDWMEASNMGRELLKTGHELPPADLQIAAVALRTDSAVYTTDPHFDLIPNLKRFDPDS